MSGTGITQGAAANRNGRTVEQALMPIFQGCGFDIFSEKDVKNNPALISGLGKYILTNVGYISIYGSDKSRTEYLIVHNNRRVRVEVKFQASAGSVDEKYPYMLLNGIYAYPESEVIFLVDGGGYKPGARKWLQDQIDNDWLEYKEAGKDIKLMNLGEFIAYFTKEFGH